MILTDENFLQYCISNYSHPGCSLSDFLEDMNKIVHIKKLIKRILKNDTDVDPRLLLNHFVVLSNVFGVPCTVEIVKFKLPIECKPIALSCMLFLSYCTSSDMQDCNADFDFLDKLNAIIS
jgi:hypothetical protein